MSKDIILERLKYFHKNILQKSAGAHNSIYRGKNITDLFYNETLTKQIKAGTFDDIYIGDYILGKTSGYQYLVAGLDYRYMCGDTEDTTHHVLMIPACSLDSQPMNSENITTGAYVGSEMYTTNMQNAKEIIIGDFGENHILSHRQYLANAVTDGNESGESWYDSTIDLLGETAVYGSKIRSGNRLDSGENSANTATIDKGQLPLFQLKPDAIICRTKGQKISSTSRVSYWLRDVVSSSNFAYVNYYGNASSTSASGSNGVRPAFLIY